MKINKKYNGTIIGGIFTVMSLLLILTIFIPQLLSISFSSILLGFFVEDLIGVKATFVFFVIIKILSLIIIFIKYKREELKNIHIIIIMTIEYFIIHPLGFFIYWAIALNFKGDGQIALAVFLTYPISSFGFLMLGILIDIVKRKPNEVTHS